MDVVDLREVSMSAIVIIAQLSTGQLAPRVSAS
jgi:hypothetical protein